MRAWDEMSWKKAHCFTHESNLVNFIDWSEAPSCHSWYLLTIFMILPLTLLMTICIYFLEKICYWFYFFEILEKTCCWVYFQVLKKDSLLNQFFSPRNHLLVTLFSEFTDKFSYCSIAESSVTFATDFVFYAL